mmetsp:Transcript_41755/g.88986  ORF Transcript_41755/g.88986 Transcript_41755/m.88986 type:complete len:115 (+) Transcript_41755:1-345(+)
MLPDRNRRSKFKDGRIETWQGSEPVFHWIVATAEVADLFGGDFPELLTRYAPILNNDRGATSGLVRLFESRDQVLPLICFDGGAVFDKGDLEEIQQGLTSIFFAFFRQLAAERS